MKAKKHLGQHFLNSKTVLKEMLEAASVAHTDTVLEIGPGKGVLTRELLSTGAHVIAVETDEDMLHILSETFEPELSSGALTLLAADILNVSLTKKSLMDTLLIKDLKYKVVANIPYYITGEIIKRFLTAEIQPESMTLLVQKEVAERIAKSKKESILSLSVKAYGVPRYVSTVAARYFNPPPKVDSAVLHIAHISKLFFSSISEDHFFKVVKSGFSSKRKKLSNNLAPFGSKEKLSTVFSSLGIIENARAEELHLDEWATLATELK